MRAKTIMLCSVVLTLGGCNSHNSMWHGMVKSSGSRYTPRAEISQKDYTSQNRMEDRMDKKSYKEYEHRESCQNYRKPPRNYNDGCIEDEMVAVVTPAQPKKIVRSYTVLFDFDKSNIRGNEMATLDRIAQEINQYHPKQVTVTGYTDSHGTDAYNRTLSRHRQEAVSYALMQRGIKNQMLDRNSRGEYDQAVQTDDGVKNQENRRVVIDFRR